MSYGDGDQVWINHRLSEYARCHTIEHLQAAIARGYERGKAEREYEGQLLAIARQQRDDAKADRDRLAKRCEEVEADVAGADEFLRSTAWENPAGAATIAARVRLAYEAGVTDGAHNEAMVERANASRLAAIRARGEVPR